MNLQHWTIEIRIHGIDVNDVLAGLGYGADNGSFASAWGPQNKQP